jgi:polyisoprenoid-binding protein YceI
VRPTLLFAIAFTLGPFGCPDSRPEAETKPDDSPAEPATPDATDSGGNDTTAEAPPQPKPTPPTGPQTLAADPAQSKVSFAVSRATVGHIGTFGRYKATLVLDADKPKSLDIVVETASVEADAKGLTSHLKSADFFDVDKYPTASFTTAAISVPPEAEPNEYLIKGTMELHGVEAELEFPATIEVDAKQAVGRATLDISAKRFGIDYAGMEAELADDAVALEIELTFPRVAG